MSSERSINNIDDYFIADEYASHTNYLSKHKKLRLLPGEIAGEFYSDYCRAVDDGDDSLAFGEKVDDTAPVIITLTLQYKSPVEEGGPFDKKIVAKCVKIFQTTISDIVECEENDLVCFVLLSDEYKKGDMTAYSARFQFPNSRMAVSDQKRFLRNAAIKALKKGGFVDKLKNNIGIDMDSIVDSDTLDTFVPMYGSKVSNNRSKDVMYLSYNGSGQLVEITDLVENIDVHRHKIVMDGYLTIKKKKSYDLEYWLPLLLSLKYESASGIKMPKNLAARINGKDEVSEEEVKLTSAQQICDELLEMIAPSRYDNTSYWKKIGMVLYTVYNGTNAGLLKWIDASKKIKKYRTIQRKEGDDFFLEFYNTFSHKNYRTEVTLGFYAREDNPSEYKKWHIKKYTELLTESVVSGTSGSVARAFYMKNWLNLTYIATRQGKSWYLFNGSYLEYIPKGPISELTDFRHEYIEYHKDLIDEREELEGTDRKDVTKLINASNKIMNKLDGGKDFNSIMQYLEGYIGKKTRGVVLDYDYNLTATAKDVVLESYDTAKNRADIMIRPGNVEDFCTKHACQFDETMTRDHYWVKKLIKRMLEICGDMKTVIYVLYSFSKALRSHNGEKIGTNWAGPPDSGKTALKRIIELAFGVNQYSWTSASTALTGQRNGSENASPGSAQSNNCKIHWFEELETTGKINEGYYCQEIGGSNRHNRKTFDDGQNSEATAKVIIVTNDVIPLSPKEQIKAKHLVMMFLSQFLTEKSHKMGRTQIPETKEEQRASRVYKRKNLDPYIAHYAKAFQWLIVDMHKEIDFSEDTEVPKKILRDTNKYWETYDPYTIFVRRNMKETEDESVITTVEMVYPIFAPWFKNMYQRNAPDINEFRKCMNGVIGRPNEDDSYQGWMLYSKTYKEFIDDMYEPASKKSYINEREAYRDYKGWMERWNPKQPINNFKTFVNYMKSAMGNYVEGKGFRRWQLKNQEEEEE